MSRDKAGNYVFEVEGRQYKIQRMGWREQREFIGQLKNVFNDEGVVEPFTEGFNKAQDWLLPKIAHVDGSLNYLKDDYLETHLDGFDAAAFETINTIFLSAVGVLSENFTQKDSHQKSSNQELVQSSENITSQSKLSKTLKK